MLNTDGNNDNINPDDVNPTDHSANGCGSNSAGGIPSGLAPTSAASATAKTTDSSSVDQDHSNDPLTADDLDIENDASFKSTLDSLEKLRKFVDFVVKKDHIEPMLCIREKAKELRLSLGVRELQQLYEKEVAKKNASRIEPLRGGDVIRMPQNEWLLHNVLLAGALNVLVGMPKVGKSAWTMGLIGALLRGEPNFLGLAIPSSCPPLIVVGTDQSLSDWGPMLEAAQLLESQPDGTSKLHGQLVAFFNAEHPICLDEAGIAAIAALCADHPGALLLLDSATSLTQGLGISENSHGFVNAFRALEKAVSPHQTTIITLHHTRKDCREMNPVLACRGTSALPAIASRMIGLFRYPSSKGCSEDSRVVLIGNGRRGAAMDLVIEQIETTDWVQYGSRDEVLAQELPSSQPRLNQRQSMVLAVLEELHRSTGEWQSKAQVKAGLPPSVILVDRLVTRTFEQLEKKGLVSVQKGVTTSKGQENRYGSVAVQQELDSCAPDDQGDEHEPAGNGCGNPPRPPFTPRRTSRANHVVKPGDLSGVSEPCGDRVWSEETGGFVLSEPSGALVRVRPSSGHLGQLGQVGQLGQTWEVVVREIREPSTPCVIFGTGDAHAIQSTVREESSAAYQNSLEGCQSAAELENGKRALAAAPHIAGLLPPHHDSPFDVGCDEEMD